MGGPGMSDFGHAQGNGMGGGINPMPPQSMPPLNSGGIMPPGMGSPVPMPPTQMGPPISLGGFPANPQSGPGGEMGHPPPMPTMPGMGGPRPMNPALGMGARKPTFPRI